MTTRAERLTSPADGASPSPGPKDPLSFLSRAAALLPICNAIGKHVDQVWAADPTAIGTDLGVLLSFLVAIYKRAGASHLDLAYVMMQAEKALPRDKQFTLSPAAQAAEDKWLASVGEKSDRDPIDEFLHELNSIVKGDKTHDPQQQAGA